MNRRSSHKVGFILFPVLFFLLGYAVVFCMAFPFWNTFSSVSNLLFFDTKQHASLQLGDIFTAPPAKSVPTVKLGSFTFPQYGDRFGQLTIPSASVKADLYFGDGADELKNGVGIYNGSFIPGFGRTILVAGHNHTFFHTLGQAKKGNQITIETNYGTYAYQITQTEVKSASDTSAYDLNSQQENLILYTCYPFDDLGLTPQRYYVYAKYLSGPKIEKQG